jgi:hypothetical protein
MANLRKSTIGVAILSLLDLAVGVAAIFTQTIAVKVLGTMASGLTFCKAVQVCVKSKKGAELAKSVAVKSIPLIIHIFTMKENGKMKEFFKKIGTNLKNNKITAVVVVFVALVCAGAGYAINYFVEAFGTSIPAPYNIVIAVVATLLLFAILAAAVIYLGHDDKNYALIRKIVKVVGKENAAEELDKYREQYVLQAEEEKARAEAEAKAQAEDDKIYRIIQEEEAAREKAERDRKIAEWRAKHAAELEPTKPDTDTVPDDDDDD